MDQFTPKEVRILESAEDIQERREQVQNRDGGIKRETRIKREKLEDRGASSILSVTPMNSKVGFMRNCRQLARKAIVIQQTCKLKSKNIKHLRPK